MLRIAVERGWHPTKVQYIADRLPAADLDQAFTEDLLTVEQYETSQRAQQAATA